MKSELGLYGLRGFAQLSESEFILKILLIGVILVQIGCSTSPEPVIVPPQPSFTDSTMVPDPVDGRIYAGVDAGIDVIYIEWKPDTTNNTSGYILYRSTDSTVGADGLLLDSSRTSVAQFESTNQLIEPLPTICRDTFNIVPGATYYYQLIAYYRSPTNKVTYSKPTHVDLSTSFHYTNRVQLLDPSGFVTPPPTGLKFRWQDPEDGGTFQIIVKRIDVQQYVWSGIDQDFQNTLTVEYPSTAVPLVAGGQYQWRVKRVIPYGGSSSPWMTFYVSP